MRTAIAIAIVWIVTSAALLAQRPSIDVVPGAGATASVAENALVTIASPKGIGSATIARKGAGWPALRLRLNLRGLESVKVIAGRVTLNGAVSSLREGGQLLSISTAAKAEDPIDRSSMYWTEIRAFDERGRVISTLPPAGGWFEFEVPAALLPADVESVRVEWIDFYR